MSRYIMVIVRIASLPLWTRSKAMDKALLSYLISHAFVGMDHELACIWTRVCNVSLKTIFASTTVFELGIVITIFELRCMMRYLWTYVTCGLYVESCMILVVCWIIWDPLWYLTDNRVYRGSSMIVRSLWWLPLYSCSHKLDGSATSVGETHLNIKIEFDHENHKIREAVD